MSYLYPALPSKLPSLGWKHGGVAYIGNSALFRYPNLRLGVGSFFMLELQLTTVSN